jgi:hypothetical protein
MTARPCAASFLKAPRFAEVAADFESDAAIAAGDDNY